MQLPLLLLCWAILNLHTGAMAQARSAQTTSLWFEMLQWLLDSDKMISVKANRLCSLFIYLSIGGSHQGPSMPGAARRGLASLQTTHTAGSERSAWIYRRNTVR